MIETAAPYTTQLSAGLGMVEETLELLELWQEGVNASKLSGIALDSGQFPNVSARRLRNIVAECFAPRLLSNNARPALQVKALKPVLENRAVRQLLFLFSCRANKILHDFVTQVYWSAYSSGKTVLDNEAAREFVSQANRDGLTTKLWADSSVKRVSSYLTGCCRDFGLLSDATRLDSEILPFRIEPVVVTILAYDLHLSGLGDNKLVASPDWALFGLDRSDVLQELKRQSRQGLFIVQAAGGVVTISWACKSIEELVDVIAND